MWWMLPFLQGSRGPAPSTETACDALGDLLAMLCVLHRIRPGDGCNTLDLAARVLERCRRSQPRLASLEDRIMRLESGLRLRDRN